MLKANFNNSKIKAQMQRATENLGKAITMRLQRLGEDCVNIARNSGDYNDQTGNLRSSIGYVIVSNGAIVSENFKNVTGSGESGKNEAKTLADNLSLKFPTGYALIVVAGMDYAYHVETTGRDVLSSAEHYAIAKLPALLSQLKININL
jgi:hypothetical protein